MSRRGWERTSANEYPTPLLLGKKKQGHFLAAVNQDLRAPRRAKSSLGCSKSAANTRKQKDWALMVVIVSSSTPNKLPGVERHDGDKISQTHAAITKFGGVGFTEEIPVPKNSPTEPRFALCIDPFDGTLAERRRIPYTQPGESKKPVREVDGHAGHENRTPVLYK